MKTSIIASVMLVIALGVIGASFSPRGAAAQQNVCQTNPDPVDAADPSVIVTTPASGAGATSPLHVAGQARVFEATVSLALYDADGAEITATTTQAAEGQVLSDFSTDVSFSVSADTPACLWVYEVSAKDGSPVNVVQVPITLHPTGLPSTGSAGPMAREFTVRWLGVFLVFAGAGLLYLGKLAARRA